MQNGGVHNVIIEGRKKISVSGVQDMECFDENKVVVYTNMGVLEICGINFHMNKLSLETEEIIIEGDIDSVIYEDANAHAKVKKNLISRLFG